MNKLRTSTGLLLLLIQLLTSAIAFADPALLNVVSRKSHGAAGSFDVKLKTGIPIGGAISVEPRAIGAGHNIVFQFDNPVTSFGLVSVTDANGVAIGTATPSLSGQDLIVTLTGIADNIRVLITVAGVNGATDVAVTAGFLIGDSDGSAAIDLADLNAVKSRSGQSVSGNMSVYDVNTTGLITAADIVAVKNRLGASIPTTPGSLTITFAGAGGGAVTSTPAGLTCSANCMRNFNLNTNITLTATPNATSSFTGWSGACSGTNASTQVTVASTTSCTATFASLPQVNLAIALAHSVAGAPAGTDTGTVTSSPSGINCGATCASSFLQSTVVTLTATPVSGAVFSGWSGGCSGTSSTATVTLASATTCTASFGPGVPSGSHPRLWLGDPDTFTRLTTAAGANTVQWTNLKSFCDNNTLPTFEYQGDQQFLFAANFSLCYRIILARSGAAAADPYALKAVNVLQGTAHPLLNFTAYSTDSGFGIRNYVPAMALLFDWLYDSPRLTPALKSAIVSRIQNWMDFYATSGYANNQPISNYNSGYVLGSTLAGIAVYGESAQANAIWTTGKTNFNNGRATFDQTMPGGHWVEGWNYGTGVFERYAQSASAIRSATGDPSAVTSSWLSNNTLFKSHAVTPDGKYFYDDGLWSGDSTGDPRYNDVIVAGFTYGWGSTTGQIARAYINKVVAGGVPLNSLIQWNAFLYYDPAAVPLNMSTLPASYLATGTGLVAMRGDWTNSNASWGTVIAGPYRSYQGEQDNDQGHIEIYKYAQLLIDAGHDLYGDPGIKNTVHHNTYTFEGRTDNTSRSYEGQLATSGACPNPLAPSPNNPNASGLGSDPIGVNAYSDGGTYAFSSGEFSAAYQSYDIFPSVCGSVPVSWMNRNMLFIRPNIFVVYDQIQKVPTQPALVPKMHLHMPAAPTALAPDNRQLTMDNGGGRLQISTVLPAVNTSTLVHEVHNDTTGPGLENWHLAIRATDATPMYQKFLTVLRAGQAVAGNTFPTVSAIAATNASGTLIAGLPLAESGTAIAAVFADNGTRGVPATFSYQYALTTPIQHYIAKLKVNTFYAISSVVSGGTTTVTVTEGTTGTKSDAAGVIAVVQ